MIRLTRGLPSYLRSSSDVDARRLAMDTLGDTIATDSSYASMKKRIPEVYQGLVAVQGALRAVEKALDPSAVAKGGGVKDEPVAVNRLYNKIINDNLVVLQRAAVSIPQERHRVRWVTIRGISSIQCCLRVNIFSHFCSVLLTHNFLPIIV